MYTANECEGVVEAKGMQQQAICWSAGSLVYNEMPCFVVICLLYLVSVNRS